MKYRSLRTGLRLTLAGGLIFAVLAPSRTFASQSAVLVPPIPTAQSATPTAVAIAALEADVQSLEAQIAAIKAGPAAGLFAIWASTPAFQRPLAFGARGTDVADLQRILISEGFLQASATGYFGALTQSAVAAFQRFHGLEPVGSVGPKTRALLNAIAAAEQNRPRSVAFDGSADALAPAASGSTTPGRTSAGATATGLSTTSTAVIPIASLLTPTDTSPGFGGGASPAVSSAASAAPPGWVESGTALDLDFANQRYYGGTLGALISTSRASPESCNWTNGTVTYAATDTPCITDLGLAIWQGSTNLLEDSGDLSGSAWSNDTTGSGAVSVTGDASTSPDGTQTAALVTVDVSAPDNENPTDEAVREQSFAAGAASYSDSIWLKAATPSDVGKVIVLGISTDWWVNSTRVILTDQWQRYSVDDETLSADGNSELFVGYWSARDIPQDGPVSFLAWGAQAESGPGPTAYIPTAASTVSRADDDIAATGALAAVLAGSSGAVNLYTSGSQPNAAATLLDATGTALLGKTSADALTTDVPTALTNSNPAAWQGEVASGLAWNGTGRSLALNGVIASDTQAITPSDPFAIGSTGGVSSFLNGYVTRLTAWSAKVADATLAAMPNLDNTTYYVAADGNDNNSGTSPLTPWQTVAKVNAGTYYPGDKILFNGGDAFTGCLVFTNANTFSASSSPLTVGSYGTGKFTLDADCPYYKSEGVFLSGVSGFTLDNAILAGDGSGTWFGIRVVNPTSRVVGGITIENSDVSGFYHSGGDYSSEIETDGYPGAGITAVNISDNTLHGTSGPTSADENGVNGYSGSNYPNLPGVNLTNFVYEGNTIYDIGGKPGSGDGGNGIVANGVNGAIMEYNVVHDMGANMNTCGGAAGIWAYGSNNILIQYNEVYKMEPSSYTTGCDWDGFDLDGSVTNATEQYNYSHDNWGSGFHLYISGTWNNNTVRYNIAENNATTSAASGFGGIATVNSGSGPLNLNIYNNTVSSDGVAGTGLFVVQSGNPSGTTVADNVFYSTNGANLLTSGSTNPTGITFANNDYYATGAFKIKWHNITYNSFANFEASTTEDATGTSTDPLFVGTPSAGMCNTSSNGSTTPQPCPSIYALQASSTLIGTGLDLTPSPYNFGVGSQDYYGNPIPQGPGTGFNIGAYGGTQ